MSMTAEEFAAQEFLVTETVPVAYTYRILATSPDAAIAAAQEMSSLDAVGQPHFAFELATYTVEETGEDI